MYLELQLNLRNLLLQDNLTNLSPLNRNRTIQTEEEDDLNRRVLIVK